MVCCKGCGSDIFVKNGIVRGVQRYKCRSCLLNFVEKKGDLRKKPQTAVKKALCVMLYSPPWQSLFFYVRQDIRSFAVHNLSLGSRGDGQDSGASCLLGYYGDGILTRCGILLVQKKQALDH